MNSQLSMKKMDDEHIRIVNLELVPKEVQNYISHFKLDDEPKHHPYVDAFNSALVKKLTAIQQELNLPMCLSYMNKESDTGSLIPDDLKNRIATAKARGNLAQIENQFKNLKLQEQNHAATIQQLKIMLKTESDQDASIKNLPGYQGRVTSAIAAKSYNEVITKFENDSSKASEANNKLRKMFDDDKDNMAKLFLGNSEIEEKFESFKSKKATEEE